MRLKLSTKLFIANLGIILALVLALLAISYSTGKSLLGDFIKADVSTELEKVSVSMGEYYKKHDSWGALVNDTEHWEKTVKGILLKNIDTFSMPRPPFKMTKPELLKNGSEKPNSDNANVLNIPPSKLHLFLTRIALLDAEKKTLIEPIEISKSYLYQKILLENRTIGWLALGMIEVNNNPVAKHYLSRQLTISYWLAVIGVVVAAVFSYFLSKHITSPLQILTSCASQLAKRDFNVNVNLGTNDEFDQLGKSFNNIAKELSNYEKRQKQWLMDISHELRTPLTILYGEIEGISSGVTQCDDTMIESLKEEVLHLNRLVDDLHDLSVTETLEFSCSKTDFDIHLLVNNHLARYANIFLKKNIVLKNNLPSVGPIILGDYYRISQVIKNILDNSARYIESPGELIVEAENVGKYVVIHFSDSGPGVPDAAISKLFDRLFRIESSRNRKTGGAGLGLAICKNIVNAHGGEIWASNNSQGGLSINFKLPLTMAPNT